MFMSRDPFVTLHFPFFVPLFTLHPLFAASPPIRSVTQKGRGCRDQLLTLVLLGQVKAVAKRGMLAALIDFKVPA